MDAIDICANKTTWLYLHVHVKAVTTVTTIRRLATRQDTASAANRVHHRLRTRQEECRWKGKAKARPSHCPRQMQRRLQCSQEMIQEGRKRAVVRGHDMAQGVKNARYGTTRGRQISIIDFKINFT